MATAKETVGPREREIYEGVRRAFPHSDSQAGKQVKEKRKHPRFQVPKGTFVSVGPYDAQVGQIIDMGMGGLAFRYVGRPEPFNGELSIFLSERDFYLGRIPFKTVSDCEIAGKGPSSPIAMRRSGVRFRKLTDYQVSQLEYFIQNHTLGEA